MPERYSITPIMLGRLVALRLRKAFLPPLPFLPLLPRPARNLLEDATNPSSQLPTQSIIRPHQIPASLSQAPIGFRFQTRVNSSRRCCSRISSRRATSPVGRQYPKMASSNGETEHQWIENIKSGGAVPCLAPESCPNGWATPPGDSFMVRGPEYLTNKVKIPGGESLLKPLGFDWIKGPAKICEILKDKNHRVRKAIDEEVSHGKQHFVWAFNLQLPKDNYSAIFYFVSLEPVPEGSLMDQFLKGDDAFRKSRLKLIANIVKGPWIVRTAVGEQAICILGRALTCKYVQGSNFIEVDVDIGSSIVANAIVHLAFGYITTLTVDLAFLIESQTESELPERLLGAVRFSELNPGSAGHYERQSEEHQESTQSRSVGFWQGFWSNNQGNPTEPSPSLQNTNGNLHKEEANENAK
ncbi:hypothetical protein SETIT_6G060700v2 [Setaria italica]|uniref:Protein ENHANCED DISEASE RESISTANCE 2 C-terminal domain-containing protein n=1 Tax=Setaria italica TaxID=4555 RepID=A0A368RIJ3_SETIT|nr:hypothetical protein SETIT_6G060700v2 [Setaria italica]